MSSTEENRTVTSLVEVSQLVRVTVPLPDGVDVEEVEDATSAVDCVSALPLALRSALLEAAVAESAALPTVFKLAEVHFLEVL